MSPAARSTAALIGNPNTGKTTLFNALSGLNHRTGNYPGVTVETRKGHQVWEFEGERYTQVGMNAVAGWSGAPRPVPAGSGWRGEIRPDQ